MADARNTKAIKARMQAKLAQKAIPAQGLTLSLLAIIRKNFANAGLFQPLKMRKSMKEYKRVLGY